MTARLTMLLLFATVAAALASGCGGSDDSSTASAGSIDTSSLSKAEFLNQATAVCRHNGEGLLPLYRSYVEAHEGAGTEQELFAQVTQQILFPRIEEDMATIRKLGAPAGDEKLIEEFLVKQQQALDEVAKLRAIKSRFELERYFAPASKVAWAYGLGSCAQSPEPSAQNS